MSIYINIMESILEEKYDAILDKLDCCHCEQCRADVIAFALNRLPSKYVVTPQGAAYSKAYSLGIQHDADIMSSLALGAAIVKEYPRHKINK